MRTLYILMPIMLLVTLLEWFALRRRGPGGHNWRESASNLTCAAIEQSMGILAYPILFGAYHAVESRLGWLELDAASWSAFAIAFVLSDVAFYWFHRAAHTVNVMWATHIVHHQSSTYNLTVGARNSAFQRFFAVPFYAPLAFIGVPSLTLLTVLGVSVGVQYCLHTSYVKRNYGPIGWLFSTPSHHRVHHSTALEDINKNFGAILIIWDRMFGTFKKEHPDIAYGIADARHRTNNPVWANFIYFWHLLSSVVAKPRRALSILFGRPGAEA